MRDDVINHRKKATMLSILSCYSNKNTNDCDVTSNTESITDLKDWPIDQSLNKEGSDPMNLTGLPKRLVEQNLLNLEQAVQIANSAKQDKISFVALAVLKKMVKARDLA